MNYSLVIPTLNEINYLNKLLECINNFEVVPSQVIFVDGGSTDGTVEFLKMKCLESENITLINNRLKFVPNALNIGIELNSATILIRLDAHSTYAKDYTKVILDVFNSMPDVDIVGGPMRIHDNISSFQKAVGIVTTLSYIIGPSKFHDVNYSGFAETVYLGAYRSSLFSNVGLFDVKLNRNQDDEFHFRAFNKGVKIYQDSRIKSYYFPRKSYRSLYRQYFEYGLFKPLVYYRNRSTIRLRHLIPSFLCIYLVIIPFFVSFGFLALLPIILYILLITRIFIITRNLWVFLVIPTIHLSYGFGFIKGLKVYLGHNED